ncbi:hypothetical protein SCG7109_AB_00340 [Chlamydiales bacterium SCGC AG-110-M15]|nr:hypothetical protein SCG7109_AB_00340 [Chlamydiales bacterium SCGC AG-110-M15]
MPRILLWLLLLNLSTLSTCVANQESPSKISQNEQNALETFFRKILLDSSMGYTFFGEKPSNLYEMSTMSAHSKMIPGTDEHREYTYNQNALRVWNKLPKNSNSAKFILNTQTPSGIVLINKKSFLNVVKKNIRLFQYILGTEVSPESLLREMTSPTADIGKILHNNDALLGIVLGYGAENAIAYERGKEILKPLEGKAMPTFPYRIKQFGESPEETLATLKKYYASKQKADLLSKFSYQSVVDELDNLFNPQEELYRQFPSTPPYIGFTALKTSQESQKLISSYRKTHNIILEKRKSPHLLEELFEKFSCLPRTIENNPSNFELISEKDKDALINQLALYIWTNFLADDEDAYEAFMEGFDKVRSNGLQIDLSAYDDITIFDSFSNSLYPEIRKKELLAQELLRKYQDDKSFNSLVSKRLFTQTLHEGNAPAIDRTTVSVSAYYQVTNANENEIESTSKFNKPKQIKLSETIPGFAHGLLGMKVGEVREIIIHPCFAYGFENVYGEGKPLFITIELVEIFTNDDALDESFPRLIPFDLVQTLLKHSISSYEDYEKANQKYATLNGIRIANFYYKAQKYFSLEDLQKKLKKLKNGKCLQIESQEELLNQFHLDLYSQNSFSSF